MSAWTPGTACSSGMTYSPISYNPGDPPSALFMNDHYCTEGGNGSWAAKAGTSNPDLSAMGRNDLISSLVVPPNTYVDVYRDNNFTGAKKTFGPGVYPHMGFERYDTATGDHLDDNITSYKVYTNPSLTHNNFLRDCCLGRITPSSTCANYAKTDSTDCQSLMEPICTASRDVFFDSGCRGWLQNVNTATRNRVASAMCPFASTTNEKEWCACFTPRDLPPEYATNQGIKALWACMDQTCNDATKALQPFDKNCPTTTTICNQQEIKTAYTNSSVKNNTVQNACGNIYLNDQKNTPPPVAPPDASAEISTKPTTNPLLSPIKIITIVAVILLIIVVITTVIAMKKKK